MEPAVLTELVEQHEPEVPVTSGPDLPAAVEAGTAEAAEGEDECCCRKQRGQSSSSCPPSPGVYAQC